MRALVARALGSRAAVPAACAASLALGLFFTFVWAPHPWGQEGFDHYHQLALTLAAGRPFPTMDVPWGYAYFLAAFYRTFGDHPAVPLAVQAILNAALPLLVFVYARTWLDQRTATAAALITGIFSFNTVYASTQSSDAVCNVIFMAAIVAFAAAIERNDGRLFALVGLLTGIAPQFRPNLILIPLLLAGYLLMRSRSVRLHGSARLQPSGVWQGAAIVGFAALALAPWTIRNYRLTRQIVPASVHSGTQLWYGSLQTGPYLTSRAHNPRAVFEAPVFTYTSLDHLPLVVTARPRCGTDTSLRFALTYRTDRDATPRQITERRENGFVVFDVPTPHAPSVVYLDFDASSDPDHARQRSASGEAGSMIVFVSHDHLGDLDLHGDLIDIFDVIRLMRQRAWHEPPAFAAPLAAAGIGKDDLEAAVRAILQHSAAADRPDAKVARFSFDAKQARLELGDSSTVVVPRQWRGLITDIEIDGVLAGALMSAAAPVRTRPDAGVGSNPCAQLDDVSVNEVFYRREPHLMHRYFALAWDNIERDPWAFARASFFRSVRLFFVQGSDDRRTAQQFAGSSRIYTAATIASAAYAVLFVSGALVAWRQRRAVGLPLLLIAYVPATIAPMLTNMRYTVTMQPFVFMFVAVALVAVLDWTQRAAAPMAARAPSGTGTARPL